MESMLRQEPVSLTAAELRPSAKPVTRAERPVRVWAWVRYPSQAVRVQALADAWTDLAVRITYREPFIASDRTIWVWANAVERAGPDEK